MSQDKEREAFEALKDLMHTIHIGFAIKSTQEARARKAIRTLESALEQARAALASQQAVKGEPVAWFRYENGMRIYYETKAWDDLQPLFASHPSREPQWQPIETAPKDGTDVLVMYMHIDTQVVHNAFYNHDDPDDDPAWWSYDKSEVSRVRLDGFMTPTHWMPLPPPPGIHSREGGSK